MWLAVACLIVVSASPTIKIMEGQYKLVGPQRPSTHGQLFASLPITRNLIFIDRRIEISFRAVGPSILYRPSKPTRHQKSETDPLEWPDGSVGAIATPNIAIPPHFNWDKWLRWRRTHGRIPQRRSMGPRFLRPSRLRERGWGSPTPWRVPPKEARHARQRSFEGIG
jgi:hypothetical protein